MDESSTSYFVVDRTELLDAVTTARPAQRPVMMRTLRELAIWGPRVPGAVRATWSPADERHADYTLAFGDEFEAWFRVDESRCEIWIMMVLRSA